MSEACTFSFPNKLRELFVHILLFNEILQKRARYDLEEQATLTEQYTSTLNEEQKQVYDIILHSVTTIKEYMTELYQRHNINVDE